MLELINSRWNLWHKNTIQTNLENASWKNIPKYCLFAFGTINLAIFLGYILARANDETPISHEAYVSAIVAFSSKLIELPTGAVSTLIPLLTKKSIDIGRMKVEDLEKLSSKIIDTLLTIAYPASKSVGLTSLMIFAFSAGMPTALSA